VLRFIYTGAECFYMELNGGHHVGESAFVGVSLTDDRASEAEWIGNVAVWMLFYDDLELANHVNLRST